MIFEKKISIPEGALHFVYEGSPKKENFNHDSINKLIDKIFLNHYFRNDIIRIVVYLRTIFKDFKEKFIMVENNFEGTIRDVRYSNGTLKQYSNTTYFIDGKNTFKFYYDADNGGSFSFSDDAEIKNHSLFQYHFEKFVKEELNYINHLKNSVEPVTLNYEGKAIITVYSLFYKELPDLSEVGTETKFQNMLYILTEYGINFEIKQDEVYFCCYDRYPKSMIILEWLQSVIPLATNVETLDISRLNKESVGMIITIGDEIEKGLKTQKIANISFERFCYVVYCKKYRYRSNIPLNELAKNIKNDYFGEFSEEELEYYLELKANIDRMV